MLDKDKFKRLENQLNQTEKSLNATEMCLIKTANQWLEEAKNLPPISQIFGNYWLTGQVSILAGDTGVGKTLLSVCCADAITKGKSTLLGETIQISENILYMDFELSKRQFYRRYKNHTFSDSFQRAEYNPDYFGFPAVTFDYIKEKMEEAQARLLILDNITALSLKSNQDTQVAIDIMRGLKQLSREGKSFLVLAHTPKITGYEKLRTDHVAGSKHITNFADSVFFVARSRVGTNIRYIKQTKSRDAEEYGQVLVCQIIDKDGFLDYEFLKYDEEDNHLQKQMETHEWIDEAKSLKEAGLSIREIAKRLGVNKSTIHRHLGK